MSCSLMQLAANQQNAQLSTGPVTDAGKAIASRNALRHGLTSSSILIPGESQEEYDRFLADHIHTYVPCDLNETALVDKIAASNWRYRRAIETEAAFISVAASEIREREPHLSHKEAEARILLDKTYFHRMTLIMRYTRAIERTGEKALAELKRLQKIRFQELSIRAQLESLSQRHQQLEPEVAAEPVQAEPEPAESQPQPAPAPAPNGSVSQNGSVPQKPRMPRFITRRLRKQMREAKRQAAAAQNGGLQG